MDAIRLATLITAALATGLLAGLYLGFTVGVMPGLAMADGRTFVETMRQVNVAILNPWFLVCFLGTPALSLLAGALHLSGGGALLGWTTAAAALNLAALAITAAVNVPLNDALAAAGPTDGAAAADPIRAAFETAWVRANTARTLVSAAAFGCLGWAVALAGRAAP